MINTFLIIAYNGSYFNGSQIQKNLITAQSLIEEKLSMIYGKPIKVRPCSRLDKGVHAYMWACNFRCEERKMDVSRLKYALNRLLDERMYVKEAFEVPLDFDSRYDVTSKTYLYRINNGELDPIIAPYVWTPIFKCDEELLDKTLKLYEGHHDFSSFTSEKPEGDECFKDIDNVTLTKKDGILEVRIKGRSFLRYMVRFMVGSAVEVATGRLSIEEVKNRLDSKSYGVLKYKAPGKGLALEKIEYDLERSKNA